MNVILISTNNRPLLFQQTVSSLLNNAVDRTKHHLTVVFNEGPDTPMFDEPPMYDDVTIVAGKVGASASRNIGASSIPRYKRQEHVMFIDDDVYMLPGWDDRLLHVSNFFEPTYPSIISGHAHPYNHTVVRETKSYIMTDVISTVQMMMPWSLWDDVGFFAEPGGPGGSEDVDYCARAAAKKYHFVISKPHCVVHCGLTSSSGKQIVGYESMMEQNKQLVESYELTGKVRFE